MEESLRESAKSGKVELVKKLLSMGVPKDGRDPNGYTALHWAAINGKADCVTILIIQLEITM